VPFPRSGHGNKTSGSGSKKDKGKAKADQNLQQHQTYTPRTLQAPALEGRRIEESRSKSIERWPSGDAAARVKPKARRGSDTKIWTGESDSAGSSVSFWFFRLHHLSRNAPVLRASSRASRAGAEQVRTCVGSVAEQAACWSSLLPPSTLSLQSSQARTFVVGSSSGIVMPNAAPKYAAERRGSAVLQRKHWCRCQQHRPAYGLWGRRRTQRTRAHCSPPRAARRAGAKATRS